MIERVLVDKNAVFLQTIVSVFTLETGFYCLLAIIMSKMHELSLIDSNLSSAEKIASALTKSGFEVITVSSESEGSSIADEVPFQCSGCQE